MLPMHPHFALGPTAAFLFIVQAISCLNTMFSNMLFKPSVSETQNLS